MVGAAVGTLLGLWLVARIARVVRERLLKLAELDEAIEETLIARILSGLGECSTPSKVLSTLVYFAVVLMAFAAAADILGLTAVRGALWAALAYLSTCRVWAPRWPCSASAAMSRARRAAPSRA